MPNASPIHGPLLPAGWTAQPICGFLDPSGTIAHELNLVYAAPRSLRHRVDIEGQPLDEGRSFWLVTWTSSEADGDQRPAGRSITYAEARELRGGRLAFARFSSPGAMRKQLPDLLRMQDHQRIKPRPARSTPTAVMDTLIVPGEPVEPRST